MKTIVSIAFLVVSVASVSAAEVAPTVRLITPVSGATLSGNVFLTASASDLDATPVASVTYYSDATNNLGSATAAPCYPVRLNTTNLANGVHTILARALDTIGNAGTSSVVSVTVNNTVVPRPGQLQWIDTGNCNSAAYPNSVAVDSAGNVVAAGSFVGTMNLGGPLVYSGGGLSDAFVSKLSSSGAAIWPKRIGSSTDADSAQSVAIDGSGNIIVAGYFTGAVDFGGVILTSNTNPFATHGYDYNGFVAKYSSSGTLQWAKIMGFGGSTQARAVVDGSGNVFVAAGFAGSATFATVTLTAVGGVDIALLKLASANGTVLWSKRYGGVNNESASALAIDRNGDLVLTGNFYTSTDLGGGSMASVGGSDVFVAKYSGVSGNYTWAKTAGSTGTDLGKGIATDPNTGNVVITGTFGGSINFGSGLLSPGGVFLAAYNSSGTNLWSKTPNNPFYGFASTDSGNAVSVDAIGNIAFTGQVTPTVSFDGRLAWGGSGPMNQFLATYTSAGVYRWASRAGGNGPSAGTGVAYDRFGHVLNVGSANSVTIGYIVIIGGVTITPQPTATDVFVAQFNN